MSSTLRQIVRNNVREKLARDEVVASMTVRLVRNIEIARIAKTSGFDTLYIDVEHASVSAEACTVNAPGSTATTVRQGPEQAIEAPSGISLVSNAVAIVSSSPTAGPAPWRSRRTRPRSVMIPVNMALS